MYKDMAKRVLAVTLAFCMAGTMPDYTLLAAGSGDRVETVADVEALEAVAEMRLVMEESASTKQGREVSDEPETEADTEQESTDTGDSTVADTVSIASAAVVKPGRDDLPNQIRSHFTAGSFVTDEILGLEMSYNGNKLTQSTNESTPNGDYEVRCNSINDNRAQLEVKGIGNYDGTVNYTVILGKDISAKDVIVATDWHGNETTTFQYEGRPIEPKVELTDTGGANAAELSENKDYTVAYLENTNVSDFDAGIVLTGIGSYAGTRKIDISITTNSLERLFEIILDSRTVPYDKQAADKAVGITPHFRIRNRITDETIYDSDNADENLLKDFEIVAGGTNNQADTIERASIKLQPSSSGNCTGELTSDKYQITQVNLNDNSITAARVEGDFTYTGGQIRPGEKDPNEICIMQGDTLLVKDVDYEIVSWGSNTNVGEGQINIKGIKNYTGERQITFRIAPYNLMNLPDDRIPGITDKEYTGNPIEQDGLKGGTLTPISGYTLNEGADYTVSYVDNIRAGEAEVLFIAMPNSNCTGRKRITFRITKSLNTFDSEFEIGSASLEYTGAPLVSLPITVTDKGKPSDKLLVEGTDYTLEDIPTDYNIGSHSLKIKGMGFYTGEIERSFTITARSMSNVRAEYTVLVPNDTYAFTGNAIKPAINVYGVNSDGSRVELPTALTELNISYVPVGSGDNNCINSGDYEVIIAPNPANSNYTGDPIRLSYKISPKKLVEDRNRYEITLDSYSVEYTGTEIRPVVSIQDKTRSYALQSGTDFTVTYANNQEAGMASVIIRGAGNYEGEITRTFEITKKDISKANVQITFEEDQEYVYTGDTITPVISSLEIDGRTWNGSAIYQDFDIISDHKDVGTGCSFKIVGKNNYTGEYTPQNATFDITAKDITDTSNVHIEKIPNQSYNNGAPVTPEPVVTYNGKTLIKDTDYRIAGYDNNTEKHYPEDTTPEPSVTIEGIGNFSGTRVLTFNICDSILSAVVAGLAKYETTYTSLECQPLPTSVTFGGVSLKKDVDYVVTWQDNINASVDVRDNPIRDENGKERNPLIRISGEGRYGGTIEIPFIIKPRELGAGTGAVWQLDRSYFTFVMDGRIQFTGSPVQPTSLLIVYDPKMVDPNTGTAVKYQLEPGKDFRIVDTADVNAGASSSLQITGMGNFMSLNPATIGRYTIQPKPISSDDIVIEGLENIDTNTYPIDISGLRLVDTKRDVTSGTYVESGGRYVLKSEGDKPDYTIRSSGLDKPGTAKITITGRGNYSNSRDITFDIKGDLSAAKVEITDSTIGEKDSKRYWFSGNVILPKFKVTLPGVNGSAPIELKNNTDYEYSFRGATDCGSYRFVLTGKGAYAGSFNQVEYTIEQVDLKDVVLKAEESVEMRQEGNIAVDVWPGDEENLNALTLMLGRYKLQKDIDYELIPERPCSQPARNGSNTPSYVLTIRAKENGNFKGWISTRYTILEKLDVEIRFKNSNPIVYNRKEQEPEIEVYDHGEGGDGTTPLLEGTDYSVSYSNNIEAGRATVNVYGLGKEENEGSGRKQYYGIAKTEFTIAPMNLGDAEAINIAQVEPVIYSGSPYRPEPEVTWKGNGESGADEIMEAGVDFKYQYGENTNVATGGTVTIVPADGNRNFTGSQALSFTILRKNIELAEGGAEHTYLPAADVTVEKVPDQVYIAEAIKPPLNIHWGEDSSSQITLSSKDYKLVRCDPEDSNNIDVGLVQMVIEGAGNYEGQLMIPFNIVRVNLADVTIHCPQEMQYTGGQIIPEVELTYESPYKSQPVVMSPELWGYTITYGSNEMIGTRKGKVTVTVHPNGNCIGGPLEMYFDIVPRNLNDMEHIFIDPEPRQGELPTQYYNPPNPCEYDFNLRFIYNGFNYNLVKDKDYSVRYTNNDRFGDASVTITGLGNYGGIIEKKFKVRKRLEDYVAEDRIVIDDAALEYNGQALHPNVRLNNAFINERLTEKTDYELVWDTDSVNAGEHTGIIRGVGAYDGEMPFSYTIRKREISNVTFTIPDQAYTGSAIQPLLGAVEILDDGATGPAPGANTFQITGYGNNVGPGTGTVIITALENSNYTGSQTVSFNIIENTVNPPGPDDPTPPGPVITAKDPTAKDPTEKDPKPPGPDDPTPPGPVITAKDPTVKDPTVKDPTVKDPTVKDPTVKDPTAKDPTEKDPKPPGPDNPNPPGPDITNKEPDPIRIDGAEVRLIDSSFTYTGNVIVPAVAIRLDGVTLVPDVDYQVRYENNLNVGTARITITGIGKYAGSCTTTFEIIKRSVIRCNFENIVDKTYTGTPTRQDIRGTDGERTLVEGRDYEVAYANNNGPGVATITISGLGNYGGIKTVRYLINFMDVAEISAIGGTNYTQVSWSAVPGALGYAVYDATDRVIARTTGLSFRHTDLNAVTTYTYRVRPYTTAGGSTNYGSFSKTVQATTSFVKPVIKKIKAKKKKATVSWKRIKGVDGYEIYRSTKKKRGYKKIKTAKRSTITSYTNKKLKRKKKYFYRIRAYKRVNGRKVYSSYSSPKSVKAK